MSDFIPIHKAWNRIAKMHFPDTELVKTFTRDRWLIKRYCPPNEAIPPNETILKHQPSSLLPGGITYISGMVSQGRTGFAPVYRDPGKIFPPKELITEVDQAYFRRSLREEVKLWFTRHGFDLEQRTISKQDFEAALAKPSARLVGKLKSEDIAKFVKDYLDSEPKPTLTGIRKKWSDAGHGAQARDLLDEEYRDQAKARGISLKRGPKKRGPKS